MTRQLRRYWSSSSTTTRRNSAQFRDATLKPPEGFLSTVVGLNATYLGDPVKSHVDFDTNRE
jgi:hypothetical protein